MFPSIIPQPYIRFQSPITLDLNIDSGTPRPREFEGMQMHLQIDALRREIHAYLSAIPGYILLYLPDDFNAACADSMDDHCARVLELLGDDPAASLQAIITSGIRPDPTIKVPREIANWRAKAVIELAGLTAAVNTFIDALDEPKRAIVRHAWDGDAMLSRSSEIVGAIVAALSLSKAQVDAMFIQGAALTL